MNTSKIRALLKPILEAVGLQDLLKRLVWENRICFRIFATRVRYVRQLRRVRSKDKAEKIRVLFIVSEIAKWKEQKVYEAMDKSEDFEPLIGLSAWNAQMEPFCSNNQLLEVFCNAEKFFDRLGDRHVRTVRVENGKRVCSDLSEFKPDIVYFTEPWGACENQSPEEVSRIALTAYSPYYVPNYGIIRQECHVPYFHAFLHSYFCLSEIWKKDFEKSWRGMARAVRFVPAGHPALDFFFEDWGREPKKNFTIYAPHFSFPHPKHEWLEQYFSTFEWNGRGILAYAQKHPEFNWVFKPHPLLKRELLSTGLMSQEEVDAYYMAWDKIGCRCEDGDYQELFLESRAMITDCGSFLTEFGATGRPVIYLIQGKNVRTPVSATKVVYDTYYKVRNLDEMYRTLKLVLEEGEDPNRAIRIAAVRDSGIASVNASANILDYFRHLLKRV